MKNVTFFVNLPMLGLNYGSFDSTKAVTLNRSAVSIFLVMMACN